MSKFFGSCSDAALSATGSSSLKFYVEGSEVSESDVKVSFVNTVPTIGECGSFNYLSEKADLVLYNDTGKKIPIEFMYSSESKKEKEMKIK